MLWWFYYSWAFLRFRPSGVICYYSTPLSTVITKTRARGKEETSSQSTTLGRVNKSSHSANSLLTLLLITLVTQIYKSFADLSVFRLVMMESVWMVSRFCRVLAFVKKVSNLVQGYLLPPCFSFSPPNQELHRLQFGSQQSFRPSGPWLRPSTFTSSLQLPVIFSPYVFFARFAHLAANAPAKWKTWTHTNTHSLSLGPLVFFPCPTFFISKCSYCHLPQRLSRLVSLVSVAIWVQNKCDQLKKKNNSSHSQWNCYNR